MTASTNHVLSVTVTVRVSRGAPSVATTRVSGAWSCWTVSVTGPSPWSCWRHRSAAPSSVGAPVPLAAVRSSPVAHGDPRDVEVARGPEHRPVASEGFASAIQAEPPSPGVALTTTSASTRLSTSGRMSTGSVVSGRAVNSARPELPSWTANQAPTTVSARPARASSAPARRVTKVSMEWGVLGVPGRPGRGSGERAAFHHDKRGPLPTNPRALRVTWPTLTRRSREPPPAPCATGRTATRAGRRRASRGRSRRPRGRR